MTPVIDLRCRPAWLHDFFGATPNSPSNDVARWLNRRVGTVGDDEHYARSRTLDGFVAELEDAARSHGLHKAVVVGRHTPGQHLPIARLHQILQASPRLVGVAGIDPVLQGRAALDEAEHAVKSLGFVAIGIEPGFGEPPRHADDRVYWPTYELAAGLGVPVALMTGPTTPDPRFNDPAALARVAQAFPQLPIISYHGWWPNVQQAVGLAFRYDNLYLVPDMYLFQPGSQAYVEAANSFLGDQLLFGSSYPFRPIAQSIEDARRLGLKDAVLPRFFHDNAARVLRLKD